MPKKTRLGQACMEKVSHIWGIRISRRNLKCQYIQGKKAISGFFLFVYCIKALQVLTIEYSGIHVLLVSLLVDQLSGLFLISLVNQKNKLSSLRDWTKNFGQSVNLFWSVSLLLAEQRLTRKNSETDHFFCPVSETGQFCFGRPKRMRGTGQLVDQDTDQKF